MNKVLLILFLLLFSYGLSGQLNKYGVPLIKSYSTQVTQGAEYNWTIIKDKSGVVYLGNDGKGIIRYDGHTWSVITVRNDPVIRTLAVDSSGVVYVGGSYEFGYIEPSHNGHLNYVSISKRLDEPETGNNTLSDTSNAKNEKRQKVQISEILTTLVADNVVYFAGYESLFLYYPSIDSLKYINLRDFGLKHVVKISQINNRIFLSDNVAGLYELKNDKPEQIPGGEFFKMKITLVILPLDANSIFVGTYNDGVFKVDLTTGKVTQDVIDPSLNEKLKDDQVYTAVYLPSGERILGTIKGGIYVFDNKGNLISLWNTSTSDLPDNTITALYVGKDKNSELWISSAGYVSKAFINLPFSEFSTRSGYEGVVNNMIEFNGSIYLATDLGLFKSYVNPGGIRKFKKVGGIDDQVFTLSVASLNGESFLLAGSNQGLYQILGNGNIQRVDRIMKFTNESTRSVFFVRSILQSKVKPEKFYVGLNTRGFIIAECNGRIWKYVTQIRSSIQGNVSKIIENGIGGLFIFTANPGELFYLAPDDTLPVKFTTKNGLPESPLNNLSGVGKDIILSSGNGLYKYEADGNKWEQCNEILNGFTKGMNCLGINQDVDGDYWLAISDDRIYEILFKVVSPNVTAYRGLLNQMPNLDKLDFKYIDKRFWFAKSKNVYVVEKAKMFFPRPEVNTLLTRISVGQDSLLLDGTFYKTLPEGMRVPVTSNKGNPVPQIKYTFNSLSFYWTASYFVDEENSMFSYQLEGFDKGWSKWEKIYYKDFTNLPFGKYTFRVKSKTSTDIESKEAVFEFVILKPWYLTTWMIILYAIVFLFIIFVIIMAYTRNLKNENIRLEGIVAERTAIVVKQKEELESSIHYASRIQMALLPSESILSENFRNYFVLFKPRDIVSGDFYWMTKKNNRLYIVAADCTGHGVPGAFMSLLGMSFLDEIIDKEKAIRADSILRQMRLHITESLKQLGGDDEAKDGMDMALLVVDFNTQHIEFSGAYNPCFRIRKLTEAEAKGYHDDFTDLPDGSMSNGRYLLETIYASKMPIGISSRMDEDFVFFEWDLERGISYYLFSDGYVDQFGGPHGRKFMKKNFKKLILSIQDYPMKKQKEILEQNLKDWMNNTPQIDDILIMGIRTD